MNQPPIQYWQCPNCGKDILAGSDFCPHCGWRPNTDPQGSGRSSTMMVVSIVLFIVFGLPLGACGGCFLLMGGTGGGGEGLFWGAVMLLGAILLLMFMVGAIGKSKK